MNLSQMQMHAVRHGTTETPVPVDLSHVVISKEPHDDYGYGVRLLPREDVPSIKGYCEVYQRPGAPGWYAYYESDGGSSRSASVPTRDGALAHIANSLRRTYGFWERLVECVDNGDLDEKGQQVIRCGGTHYVLGPEPRDIAEAMRRSGGGLGMGGRRYDFRLNSGKYVTSHNVWYQGVVPAEFRDRLPDNAEMVKMHGPVEDPMRRVARFSLAAGLAF